jgi:hypothetical protein
MKKLEKFVMLLLIIFSTIMSANYFVLIKGYWMFIIPKTGYSILHLKFVLFCVIEYLFLSTIVVSFVAWKKQGFCFLGKKYFYNGDEGEYHKKERGIINWLIYGIVIGFCTGICFWLIGSFESRILCYKMTGEIPTQLLTSGHVGAFNIFSWLIVGFLGGTSFGLIDEFN